MKFLGQGFQKLENEQDRQTDRQRDETERSITVGYLVDLFVVASTAVKFLTKLGASGPKCLRIFTLHDIIFRFYPCRTHEDSKLTPICSTWSDKFVASQPCNGSVYNSPFH